jgi:hypothetical protein
MCPELRGWLSASDREISVFTGVNDTLMARQSWTALGRDDSQIQDHSAYIPDHGGDDCKPEGFGGVPRVPAW